MVWFKVDDAFDDHPKALAAGNAAIGLWTRCGAYSSRYLLEGFVPGEVARAKGTKTEIARLISSGLWRSVDGGFQMHDFLDYNPSEEQTKARRAATAKRVADWRERHQQRDESVSNDSRNDVTNAAPVPTRPDPSPSSLQAQDHSLGVWDTPGDLEGIGTVITNLADRFKAS